MRALRGTAKAKGLIQGLSAITFLLGAVSVLADETLAAMQSITTEVLIKSDVSWNGRPLPPYSS